jgi:hypothetical protein
MPKRKLSILLYAAFGICALLFLLHGVGIKKQWLDDASLAISIALALAGLFDRYLWKLPLLRRLLVAVPDISGTWKGTVSSTWIDPSKKRSPAPIEAYFSVHQTASSFHLRLMTPDSSSDLLSAQVLPSAQGNCRVAGIYLNEPRIRHRLKSPIHHGAIILDIADQARPLHGSYWTDRATSGDMRLDRRIAKNFPTFEAARDAFIKLSK